LGFLRVYQESPARHEVHVAILPADIHVDGLPIKWLTVALHVELVHSEIFA
jgi:hypothetical protein